MNKYFIFVLLFTTSTKVFALSSFEGSVLGDQGFYWNTPQESWIFPHRIGNIDNRVILQYTPPNTLTYPDLIRPLFTGNIDPLSSDLYNILPEQTTTGAGTILEVSEQINIGVWFSNYTPRTDLFMERAVQSTRWFHNPDSLVINDLHSLDVYSNFPNTAPLRKIDFFTSLWLPEQDIELGLRLWWGSNRVSFLNDDSTGPIDIDLDSQIPLDEENLLSSNVQESQYKISNFGFEVSGGFVLINKIRLDSSLEIGSTPITLKPNNLPDYLKARGKSFSFNTRANYFLNKEFTFGAFFRYHKTTNSMQPLRQRDGGFLPTLNSNLEDTVGPLPTPLYGTYPSDIDGTLDPDYIGDETTPVSGIIYEESLKNWQFALLMSYKAISYATLYTSLGFGNLSASSKLAISNIWYLESKNNYSASPFINIGLRGHITKRLDIYMGISNRWQTYLFEFEGFDSRIPENSEEELPPEDEDNTDTNRRKYNYKFTSDTSSGLSKNTLTTIGLSYAYKAISLAVNLNVNSLLLNNNENSNPFVWAVITYDWDFSEDIKTGNGNDYSTEYEYNSKNSYKGNTTENKNFNNSNFEGKDEW